MTLDRKRVPIQRIVERAAVNRVRSFFERHGQVYFEVDQANDYGKDAYLDLVESGKLTGQVIALQVKGGNSYKTSSGCFVPFGEADRALWVESSIPVFGVVDDPDEDSLSWVNLTEELEQSCELSGRVPARSPLNDDTWSRFFSTAVSVSKRPGSLLGLHSESPDRQGAAVWDCFALGRFDARALVMLQRSLPYLDVGILPEAVHALAHCVPHHPDIFWTDTSTIPSRTRAAVLRRLNWTTDDAIRLLRLVDDENMFRRGSVGEDVYLLLSTGWGPDVMSLFGTVVERAVSDGDERLALRALAVMQYQVGDDALNFIRAAFAEFPALNTMPSVCELLAAVEEHGWIDIA